MKYAEKLRMHMRQKGLNQQQLARQSDVSDSEVSRILAEKSQPGLENAYRLAKAVGVSLDYLVDESLDKPPDDNPHKHDEVEREILRMAKDLGYSEAVQLLRIVSILGANLSLQRLIAAKPIIEAVDPISKPSLHSGVSLGMAQSS